MVFLINHYFHFCWQQIHLQQYTHHGIIKHGCRSICKSSVRKGINWGASQCHRHLYFLITVALLFSDLLPLCSNQRWWIKMKERKCPRGHYYLGNRQPQGVGWATDRTGALSRAGSAPAKKSTSAPPSTMASLAHCNYVVRSWLLLKLFDWFLLFNWTINNQILFWINWRQLVWILGPWWFVISALEELWFMVNQRKKSVLDGGISTISMYEVYTMYPCSL